MSVVHFEVPFRVSDVGYYVNTACGAYLTRAGAKTPDHDAVTCRKCQRTHAHAARPASTANCENRQD